MDGNPCVYKDNVLKWERGRLLAAYGDNMYSYDHDGVRYYFRKNLQGDVARIFNANGYLVARYVYDAWGNHTVYDSNGNINTDENFIGNINPFRYRSYYYDTETKLYFLKTRYYDPEVGRFISPDSIEYTLFEKPELVKRGIEIIRIILGE